MNNDSLVIRNATPADTERVVPFLQMIFAETEAQKSAYFDDRFWGWQSFTPGFKAIVAMAEDPENGQVVGCYHLISREMYFNGERRRMVSLQDLAVHPEYRRHKLFLRLSNHATDQLAALNLDITYSLPNERSYPGFIKHLGYTHVDVVPVYVRPIQPGIILAQKLPGAAIWKALSGVGMGIYNRVFDPRKSLGRVEKIERFADEVNLLGKNFVDQAGGIGCTRDAAFLNWRFIDNPAVQYEAWGVRGASDLLAYVVTRRAHLFGAETLVMMDMAGEEDALLRLIGEQLRMVKDCALVMTMGLHPIFKRLWKNGFVPVPNALNPRPLNFIAKRHTDRVTDAVLDKQNWCLTLADWDVL